MFSAKKYIVYHSLLHRFGFCINHKYLDKQVWANSVNPDQMPQNVASDQGLHCLPLVQQILDTSKGDSQMDIQISGQIWWEGD